MKTHLRVPIFCLLGLIAAASAALGLPPSAQAADEDLSSSLYLVFDPETGEFVEVNDPDRVKQQHQAREPAAGAAAATGQPATAGPAADAGSGGSALPFAVVGGVAIALLGGLVAWTRTRRKAAG